MRSLKFLVKYYDEFKDKEQVVNFDLYAVTVGTTTALFGQMEEEYFGKTSVSGCSILSPEDTYNPQTGLKIAFKNMLKSQRIKFLSSEITSIYSAFRKVMFTYPEGDVNLDYFLE